MSDHTCVNDFILLGTLPDDLSNAIQEREVQCSIHVAKTVNTEEITENANECSNVSTNTDDSSTKNIVKWVDQQEGITWQAELVEWCHNNLTCSIAESTNMSESLVKGSALSYFILPNSWTRNTHTKLVSNETSESLTRNSRAIPRTAINKHHKFNDEQEQRHKSEYEEEEEEESQLATSPIALQLVNEEVKCVIDNNDVPTLQNETFLSSVTGCHIEHFNNFNSLYASEAHHSIIEEILYYLAPTRRYLHEILRYIFVEAPSHDENKTKYSVEDVEEILRYISNVNVMEQYDLNEQGFVKIDIERFDSTRVKQNVANHAFLCLSNQFRRLAVHATDKPNTNVYIEDDEKNVESEERSDNSNNREALYAEMAHVLHTMELYADRDVMISARTGGGGIMAGLASHKRLRQENDAHYEHDTIDSDVEEHTEFFNASTSNDNQGANDSSKINIGNNDKRETSINDGNNDDDDDDDGIKASTTAMENKVLMVDGDSTAYHSSTDHNEHINTNKINSNHNKNYVYDENVLNNRKLYNQREQEEESELLSAQREINAHKINRQVKVTSLSQRGLELHNEDLSTQSTILEIESASENALQRYTVYYSRKHSADAMISNDVSQNNDDTKINMYKSNSLYNGRKMIIASEIEFNTASAIYTQLLECFNDLHKLLVRHETFTNSVGRWCAQYLTECATKELIAELNNWQERQRQPRRLLTELYVRLHNATYTMERELEEYVTLKALLLL